MSPNTIFNIKSEWVKDSVINKKDYENLYKESIIENNEGK